ncbi:hypothetical protein RYX36_009460 [Vicia faba]
MKLNSFWCIIILAVLAFIVAMIEESHYPIINEEQVEAVHEKESSFCIEIIPIEKLCDEFYVVGEGETFYSITEKCNDPYILIRNPHIQDPQDIFPGVIIRLQPLL